MRSVIVAIVILLTSTGANAGIGSCANDHAVIDLAYANKLIAQSEGDRLIQKVHHGKCDGKMPTQSAIDQEKTYLINTVQISRSTLSAFISMLNSQPSLTPAEEQAKRDRQAQLAEKVRQDREAKSVAEMKELAIANAKKADAAEKKASRDKAILGENKACIDQQHAKLAQRKKNKAFWKVSYDLEFSDERDVVYISNWSVRDNFMREVKKESRFTCNASNPEIKARQGRAVAGEAEKNEFAQQCALDDAARRQQNDTSLRITNIRYSISEGNGLSTVNVTYQAEKSWKGKRMDAGRQYEVSCSLRKV